jgi:hypothetical protein
MGELLPTHCPECHRELRYLGDVEQYPVLRVSARTIHRVDGSAICRGASKAEGARVPGSHAVQADANGTAREALPVELSPQWLKVTDQLCGVARALAIAVAKRLPEE